jgi:hypothetical protein
LLKFRAAVVLGCAIGVVAGVCRGVLAQDEATPTLHVYTDLIQIPVLVLGADRQPMAPIAPGKFRISLDDGPKFLATHVRREGDDPISLSIVLDAGGKKELLPKIDEAIADLAPQSLTARDHVSIYAFGCSMVRSLDDVPAEPGALKRGVDAALHSPSIRPEGGHGRGCGRAVHLWDSVAFVTHALSSVPGRRVILVVSDGVDKGSKNKWNEVKTYAQSSGVTIFGLTYVPEEPGLLHSLNVDYESPFNSVCELSGGMLLTASGRTVGKELRRFTTLVRERYIVEFPRPVQSVGGPHGLVISTDQADAFVRASGISVPLKDPALLNDPTTVPSDPSSKPKYGKRRILSSPQ